MWEVVEGPERAPSLADHRRLRFTVRQGDEARQIFVEISGTAAACDADSLPYPISEAVRTDGLHAVERYISEHDPPEVIRVTTSGTWSSIAPSYPDS